MASFFARFKIEKIKPALKMSVQRIGLLKNKKSNEIAKNKKTIVDLMKQGKEEKARVMCEHLVRQDFLLEAYEIIELLCEILLERIRLVEAEKEIPFDLLECVSTLVYCANRTEIKELDNVKKQLTLKYGKEFTARAERGQNVNERILIKLSAKPPNAYLVMNYMKTLADENGIELKLDDETEAAGKRFDMAMVPPKGNSVLAGPGSGLGQEAYKYTDGRILKPGEYPKNYNPDDIPAAPGEIGSKVGNANSNNNYGNNGGGPAGGGGGDLNIPMAPSNSPTSKGGNGNGNGNGGGGGDLGIPVAPSSEIDLNNIPIAPTTSTSSTKTDDGIKDDPNTYNTDAAAVPDYDELTARFNALNNR